MVKATRKKCRTCWKELEEEQQENAIAAAKQADVVRPNAVFDQQDNGETKAEDMTMKLVRFDIPETTGGWHEEHWRQGEMNEKDKYDWSPWPPSSSSSSSQQWRKDWECPPLGVFVHAAACPKQLLHDRGGRGL